MALDIKSAGQWIAGFYDKILAGAMVALLFYSIVQMVITLAASEKQLGQFKATAESQRPKYPKADEIDDSYFKDVFVSIEDPFLIQSPTNRVFKPEKRFSCRVCEGPIPWDTPDKCVHCKSTILDEDKVTSDGEQQQEKELDGDKDGMLDDWEIANGLDPFTDDSQLDPDKDFFTNIEEHKADPQTNPKFRSSHPDYMHGRLNPNTKRVVPDRVYLARDPRQNIVPIIFKGLIKAGTDTNGVPVNKFQVNHPNYILRVKDKTSWPKMDELITIKTNLQYKVIEYVPPSGTGTNVVREHIVVERQQQPMKKHKLFVGKRAADVKVCDIVFDYPTGWKPDIFFNMKEGQIFRPTTDTQYKIKSINVRGRHVIILDMKTNKEIELWRRRPQEAAPE